MGARTMRVVRRVHLYSGLLLLPWVLLYGTSALLFNHATWGTDRRVERHEAFVLDGTTLAPLGVDALTREVEEALQGVTLPASEGPLRLDVGRVRLAGAYDFRFVTEETDERVIVAADGGVTRWSSPRRRAGGKVPAIAPGARVASLDRQAEAAETAFADLAQVLGLPARAEVEVRRTPIVRFDAVGPDGEFEGTYDPRRGRFEFESGEGGGASQAARDLLLRLHKTHGYDAGFGARTLWAIVVDLMGGAMIAWGLSGLLMWWQLVRTRGTGLACLALSLAAAAALGVAMAASIAQ